MPKPARPFILDLIRKAMDSLSIRESISDRAIESVDTFQRANPLLHHPPQARQDRTACALCQRACCCVDVCICVRKEVNTEACGGGQH